MCAWRRSRTVYGILLLAVPNEILCLWHPKEPRESKKKRSVGNLLSQARSLWGKIKKKNFNAAIEFPFLPGLGEADLQTMALSLNS